MGLFVDTVMFFVYLVQSILETLLPFIFCRAKFALVNKTVLVTGAGSGIGRCIALRVAARNNMVVLMDVNEQALREVAEEIKSKGQRCHTQVCDVSKKEEIAKAAQQVKTAVGGVDVLINNAGVAVMKSFLEQTEADIDRTLQINLHAHFWTMRAFLPDMISRSTPSHIVNVASVAGIAGTAKLSAYCASKFGAVGLFESVLLELDYAGLTNKIGMTLVCPFYVRTRLLQGAHAGRFEWLMPNTEPDDLAEQIVQAIIHRREILLVPRAPMTLIAMLHGILPTRCQVAMAKIFAIDEGLKDTKVASTLALLPGERR